MKKNGGGKRSVPHGKGETGKRRGEEDEVGEAGNEDERPRRRRKGGRRGVCAVAEEVEMGKKKRGGGKQPLFSPGCPPQLARRPSANTHVFHACNIALWFGNSARRLWFNRIYYL